MRELASTVIEVEAHAVTRHQDGRKHALLESESEGRVSGLAPLAKAHTPGGEPASR